MQSSRYGQLTATDPEAEGKPWRIVIREMAGPADARTADVIARVAERVRQYGGDVVVAAP